MAYIGRDIDNGLLTRQTFTGVNGSTTEFTLDQYVSDATQLIVSVAGVIQEPNIAFTASDDTLTFTGAPANGAAVWAIYLGKTISVTGTAGAGTVNVQTGTGNGSATPITLSYSVITEAELFVTLNGIAQIPGSDYTASGTTLTFSASPTVSDSILVYYFSAAGILNVVDDGVVTAASFASSGTLPAWDGNALTNLDSADLTGALPALNSTNLTGLVGGLDTTSASDPTVTTNPGTGVGTIWLNSSSGELYCCTDATTNDNVWTNIGGGAGHIIAPTNANDTFPDLAESSTTNFTFAGGTDDGTVTHYMVDQISNTSVLGVTTSEVAAGSAHSFVTQAVGSDTSVTFRVRTKDNLGLYSPGITITTIIENDELPTDATNGGAFPDIQESSSQNYTFAGATDDKGVTHYMVDQISNAALTVSASEVTAGSAHTFTAGNVGSDTAVTFRVRAKDTAGQYSSGVTVSMTVMDLTYTVASSTNSTVGTSGNYKYHVFNQSGTFTISQAGNDVGGVDYLVIAGGGSGGYSTAGGGGGAGGYRNSYNNETSGRGSSSETALTTMTASTYTITVGAGGPGRSSAPWAENGEDSKIIGTGVSIISLGGGGGSGGRTGYAGGSNGGSGGGGSDAFTASQPGGSGTSNQGYDGGNAAGTNSTYTAGGGGGAGSVGQPGVGGSGGQGGQGGAGLTSSITNSAVTRAGGGGGSVYNGTQGSGGSGGGGRGSQYTSNQSPLQGDINTGSGGGGGDRGVTTHRNGGSGIVVIRYRYQ